MSTKKSIAMALGIPTEVQHWSRENGITYKIERKRQVLRFNIGDEVALITDEHRIERRVVEGVHVDFVKVRANGMFYADDWGREQYSPGKDNNRLSVQYSLAKIGGKKIEEKVVEHKLYTLAEATKKIAAFHADMLKTTKEFLRKISTEETRAHQMSYPPRDLIVDD